MHKLIKYPETPAPNQHIKNALPKPFREIEAFQGLRHLSLACTATLSAPNPAAGHRQPMPPPETPGHLLDEAQAGIKIARRNINNLRYADDTTLKAESKEVTAS